MEVKRVSSPSGPEERRRGDRRQRLLHALIHGGLRPRRRSPRRAGDHGVSAVDWHHAQWLAIAVLIVVFSCSDALLTLMLIERGAYEVNPLMRPLIGGSALAFTLVKVGLTAVGVVLLTLMARLRAFGRIPVGALLYSLLTVYGALIFYEFRLLNAL
jgi:anti-sigma factor RsiW